MKRLLLAPLLLTLLVGCSSKDNGMINLECDRYLDSFYYPETKEFEVEDHKSISTFIYLLNKQEKKAYYFLEDRENALTGVQYPDILSFEKEIIILYEETDFDMDSDIFKNTHTINRKTGELLIESSVVEKDNPNKVSMIATSRGECIVTEDVETLF